jgi:hypothetical protein
MRLGDANIAGQYWANIWWISAMPTEGAQFF